MKREVWGIALAKILSDGAWYFYLFWLPKYLFEARGFDLKQAASVGWIPYAASGIGSLCGGGYCRATLLARNFSVDAARKIALARAPQLMPWVMLVPHCTRSPALLCSASRSLASKAGRRSS